jgi:predicted RNase H-like HicB family nuclease
MTEMFTFTAMVQKKEGDLYISSCLELNISSQGETIEDAVSNLKKAVELHIEKEGLALPLKRPFLTTFKVAGKGDEEEKSH